MPLQLGAIYIERGSGFLKHASNELSIVLCQWPAAVAIVTKKSKMTVHSQANNSISCNQILLQLTPLDTSTGGEKSHGSTYLVSEDALCVLMAS